MRPRPAVAVLLLALAAGAAHAQLPLPEAPVRVVIPDVTAFDAALTGAWRRALTGRPEEGDPLVAAWRQSPVGSKLEAQWSLLAGDLPWTWEEILGLQPRAIGIALLDVGHLEAVFVFDTPLAALPVGLPDGEAKTHGGVTYRLVARGAADGRADTDRRAGLAWARTGAHLLVATSERGLLRALDEARAGRGFPPPLPGLASVELDLEALRRDRYYRREFPFGDGPETGRVRAALRLEGRELVEVREGAGESPAAAVTFDVAGAAASGWEPDGSGLAAALRPAILEPLPHLEDRPVRPVAPLPAAGAADADRYLVNLERPLAAAGASREEGELAGWRALWTKQPVAGWGWALGADGARLLVFPWPAARDEELVELARATAERRSGRAAVVPVGDTREVRVGPDLAALAVRRRGDFLWIGPSARALADVPAPVPAPDVIRWARVDLAAARREGSRWEKVEGPQAPEQVRPLSDRILGLLGWMPSTTSITVERRRTSSGWSERIVFGTR
jgi:hypothetical protein